jgi:hypothetical protein
VLRTTFCMGHPPGLPKGDRAPSGGRERERAWGFNIRYFLNFNFEPSKVVTCAAIRPPRVT